MSEYRVLITGYSKTPNETVVVVDDIPNATRLRRAWTGFALLFAGAAVSILIPVAHFLLVPGFLIAAFVTLFQRLGQTTVVRSARGTCPDCQIEQDLDLHGRWRLPTGTACRNCKRPLSLTAVSPEPTGPGNQVSA